MAKCDICNQYSDYFEQLREIYRPKAYKQLDLCPDCTESIDQFKSEQLRVATDAVRKEVCDRLENPKLYSTPNKIARAWLTKLLGQPNLW